MVEQETLNLLVVGSSPTRCTVDYHSRIIGRAGMRWLFRRTSPQFDKQHREFIIAASEIKWFVPAAEFCQLSSRSKLVGHSNFTDIRRNRVFKKPSVG